MNSAKVLAFFSLFAAVGFGIGDQTRTNILIAKLRQVVRSARGRILIDIEPQTEDFEDQVAPCHTR